MKYLILFGVVVIFLLVVSFRRAIRRLESGASLLGRSLQVSSSMASPTVGTAFRLAPAHCPECGEPLEHDDYCVNCKWCRYKGTE
jgi:hypothetical protein